MYTLMSRDLSRFIKARPYSIDWYRKAGNYLRRLKKTEEIISYTTAADLLGLTVERVRQIHALTVHRGGLGKKACVKVLLRGVYNMATERIEGLVKSDVEKLKEIRSEETSGKDKII
jgi:hypothetical protein